jgi:LPS export ABC transporter protein LptC
MQRAQLRLMVVTLAAASLVWIGYHVAEVLKSQRHDVVGRAPGLYPEAAQRLEDFQRVKVEDGNVVWELSAREAHYFADGDRAVVQQPEMVFYEDGVEKARLASEEGNISFNGTDLQSVEMRTSVRVEGAGYVVETDNATYERERDVIVAPGAVRIVGDRLTLVGSKMEVGVSTRRLTLLGDVRVTLASSNGHRS